MNKKLLWSIVVLILATLAFVLIVKYTPRNTNTEDNGRMALNGNEVIFMADDGSSVVASFQEDSVTFTQDQLGTMTLKQTISASGARYANEDESIVFWNKGDDIVITQNNQMVFGGTRILPVEPDGGIGNTPSGKLPAGSQPTAGNEEKLTSSTWVWVRTEMSDGSVTTPKKADRFTLKFDTKGNVSGTTDCNGFGGDYKGGTDGVISFGSFMSTLMFCEGSQETEFRTAVENSSHYMFDAKGNLVLLLKFDSGSVIFKKK